MSRQFEGYWNIPTKKQLQEEAVEAAGRKIHNGPVVRRPSLHREFHEGYWGRAKSIETRPVAAAVSK